MAKTIDRTTIPDDLRNFDTLPDSAYVRLPTLCGLLGCSPRTVWTWSKNGHLPAPKKIGPHRTGWQVGAIRKFLEGCTTSQKKQ